ncbi:MAG: PspC domain-containing protein [Acidobacteriota bacterium]|nr:PspC domain-containing protein [Acidobacteriota bacterium]MDH3522375.1 PspC domain-containing protein [Acidobacteriota bacterium]
MTRGSNALVRSRTDRILGGVCAGIADWLGWRATTVRILYVLVSALSAAFPGILVYVILWIVMPAADHRSRVSTG